MRCNYGEPSEIETYIPAHGTFVWVMTDSFCGP